MAQLDALLPQEMAKKAEEIGVKKAATGFTRLMVLAILAGAFISLGAIFYTVVTAGAHQIVPYGLLRLLGGVAFSLGLILVIVGGAELFTGNSLIIISLAAGRISLWQLIRNWSIVYLGNLIGAVGTLILVFYAGLHYHGEGVVGVSMLQIAMAKCNLGFLQAICLGVLCNALVCLAVWLCFSARYVAGKILAIVFPISAFVAAGFEHSVANMFFVPLGIWIKSHADLSFWQHIGDTPHSYELLTWNNFLLTNLLPVTIGNIIGGGVLVGLVYWFIYLRSPSSKKVLL